MSATPLRSGGGVLAAVLWGVVAVVAATAVVLMLVAPEDPGMATPAEHARGMQASNEVDPMGTPAVAARSAQPLAEDLTVHVCTAVAPDSVYRSVAAIRQIPHVDGRLEAPLQRSTYGNLPGLHYLVLERGKEPRFVQWPLGLDAVESVGSAAQGHRARLRVVDRARVPVAGVQIAVEAVGALVQTADGFLWSATSNRDGIAEIEDLPSGTLRCRIIGGAVEESGRLYEVSLPSAKVRDLPVIPARETAVLRVVKIPNPAPELMWRYADREAEGWRGPVAMDAEGRFSLPLDRATADLALGLRDPLLGRVFEFFRVSYPFPAQAAYVELPETCDLTLVAQSESGPCQTYAVLAQNRPDEDDRYRISGSVDVFRPRLLGDYEGGICRVRGVVPGMRAIAVLPAAPHLGRSPFREVRLEAGAQRLVFRVPEARELIVNVVDHEFRPVARADVRVLVAPVDAAAALSGNMTDARGTDLRESKGARIATLIGRQKTDAHGVAALRIRDEHVAIVVTCPGFVPAYVPSIRWPWGMVDIQMSRGGSVELVLEGSWPDGFNLNLAPASGPWAARTVKLDEHADGRTIAGLARGEWIAAVTYRDVEFAEVGRALVETDATVKIHVPSGLAGLRTIRGQAIGPRGPMANHPIQAWLLAARPWQDPGFRADTDGSGWFEMRVPAGTRLQLGTPIKNPDTGEWDMLYAERGGAGNDARSEWRFHDLDVSYIVADQRGALRRQKIELSFEGHVIGTVVTSEEGGLRIRNGLSFPPYGLRIRKPDGLGLSAVVDPLPDSLRADAEPRRVVLQ